MRGKFVKISRLELLVLLLTALFAAGTMLWFWAAPPREGVTVRTVEEKPLSLIHISEPTRPY